MDSSRVTGGVYLVLHLVLNLVLNLVLDKRPRPQEPGNEIRPSITWNASVTMTMGDGRLQVLSLHKATDRIQNPPSYLVPEGLAVATAFERRRRSRRPAAPSNNNVVTEWPCISRLDGADVALGDGDANDAVSRTHGCGHRCGRGARSQRRPAE